MKKLIPFFASAVLLASAVGPAAQGAFVHLSFFSEVSSLALRGDQPGRPWDTGGFVTSDRPLQLDIYYDPTVPAAGMSDVSAYYPFTDPATAFWRVQTRTPHLPPLDIIRPFDSIVVTENSLTFSYWRTGPGLYETFDMVLAFEAPLATGLMLPTPPLPDLPSSIFNPIYFTAEGGEELFNLPHPGGGRVLAIFTDYRAEIVDDYPPLTPIPEPSTYGLMGALALGVLAAMRRSKGSRPERKTQARCLA